MDKIHEHLERNWLKDKVNNVRAWAMDTFLTPVTPLKCVHEWKMSGYKIYRLGKSKFATTKHICTLCKVYKTTNHKY